MKYLKDDCLNRTWSNCTPIQLNQANNLFRIIISFHFFFFFFSFSTNNFSNYFWLCYYTLRFLLRTLLFYFAESIQILLLFSHLAMENYLKVRLDRVHFLLQGKNNKLAEMTRYFSKYQNFPRESIVEYFVKFLWTDSSFHHRMK